MDERKSRHTAQHDLSQSSNKKTKKTLYETNFFVVDYRSESGKCTTLN